MKFLLAFSSVIVCFNLTLLKAHPQPGKRLADLSEVPESTITILQIGDKPPEVESPEFAHLLLKCIRQEDWALVTSCENETELKFNITKPIPIKSDASQAEKKDSEKKAEKFGKLTVECYIKKIGGVDETTSQFNMAEYTKDYKTTSLSVEQKTLASAEFKSCMTASFTTPSLPLFIRWIDSNGTKEKEVTGNLVSAMHVMRCDILALIKNGCSDSSINNSTLDGLIKDIQADIASKDLLN